MNPGFELFRKQITHPLRFRFFMLQSLPSALLAGLRIITLNEEQAVVTVKYKWFNKNPFRSMYFAVQSMAAEMSTGLLGFGHTYKRNPAVSMLVVGLEARFVKKVTGIVHFTCQDGEAVERAIETTISTGESCTLTCTSTGRNIEGETVATFLITWSFKVKR